MLLRLSINLLYTKICKILYTYKFIIYKVTQRRRLKSAGGNCAFAEEKREFQEFL